MNNLIRDRRLALGLTMKELADRTGVAEATVSRWEAGDIANMRRDRIVKLAKALDISPLLLIGYDEADLEKEKQPPVTEGLSEEALTIAQIVDRLPPEHRRLLLAQVRALESAEQDPVSGPQSPKSP